ncbi:hypothetical protein [Streptomyces sp. NPDC127105]
MRPGRGVRRCRLAAHRAVRGRFGLAEEEAVESPGLLPAGKCRT